VTSFDCAALLLRAIYASECVPGETPARRPKRNSGRHRARGSFRRDSSRSLPSEARVLVDAATALALRAD
jgi:hypothetical protein